MSSQLKLKSIPIELAKLKEIAEGLVDMYIGKSEEEDFEDLHGVLIPCLEAFLIRTVWERSGKHQLRAAKILGLHRNTLALKLKLYNFECQTSKDAKRRKIKPRPKRAKSRETSLPSGAQ